MNSSIFYSDTSMNNISKNHLEYNEGDKKFSDLKAGDIIYFHCMDNVSKIFEVAVKSGKIIHKNNLIYITIEPVNITKWKKINRLEFEQMNGSKYFGEINGKPRNFKPSDINDASLCKSSCGNFVFGTNRNAVLASAKENIAAKMESINIQNSILDAKIKSIKDKFEKMK